MAGLDIGTPRSKRTLLLAAALTGYAAGLYIFYVRYVPLIPSFQAALTPALAVVFLFAARDKERGTLAFIFLVPLINNLPYLFGIRGETPHAPTALVLFLFYALGCLVNALATPEMPGRAKPPRPPLSLPLGLFGLTVLLSAAVTFWRATNFVPIRSDRIYELVLNVPGVTSGGALMSTVLTALNYGSGIAFFFILAALPVTPAFARKAAGLVGLSTFLALCFAAVQLLADIRLGNTERGMTQGLLNGTLKDPISFGAFLAMAGPLILAAGAMSSGAKRIFFFATAGLAAVLSLFGGGRGGLVGLLVGFAVFAFLFIRMKGRAARGPIPLLIPAVVLLVALGAALLLARGGRHIPQTLRRLGKPLATEVAGFANAPRTKLWRLALRMLGDYPLTGVGVGAYIVEVSNYGQAYGLPVSRPQSAENHLLHAGAELGLPGILLSLWVLALLLKGIRRRFIASSPGWRSDLPAAGAAAGIFAYFLNLLVHTFIGSFEIKYAFWLLAALVLAERSEVSEPEASKPRARRRVLLWALPFLLAGVQLWNSLHSLSPEQRTRRFGLVQSFGFFPQEKAEDGMPFRWTGRAAGFALTSGPGDLELSLHASHPDLASNPIRVDVVLVEDLFRRKIPLAEIVIKDNGWKTAAVRVPAGPDPGTLLLIKVNRTWNPKRALGVPDPRDLGVAVGPISFRDR